MQANEQLFSLKDEARNTEHRSLKASQSDPRHSRVNLNNNFDSAPKESNYIPPSHRRQHSPSAQASAFSKPGPSRKEAFRKGQNQPRDQEKDPPNSRISDLINMSPPRHQMAKMNLTQIEGIPDNKGSSALGEQPTCAAAVGKTPSEIPRAGDNASFYDDRCAFPNPVNTGLPLPHVRCSLSPTASYTSEEEIIFTGRRNAKRLSQNGRGSYGTHKEPDFVSTQRDATSCDVRILEDPICAPVEKLKQPQKTNHSPPLPLSAVLPTRQRRKRNKTTSHVDQVILKDYIANLKTNGNHPMKEGNMFSIEHDFRGSDEWNNGRDSLLGTGNVTDAWDSVDMADFDNFSTSSEEFQEIEHVLGRRDRPSGCQYLVVGKGLTLDDARWLPLESLVKSECVAALTRTFDGKQAKSKSLLWDCDSDGSVSDDGKVDVDTWEVKENAKCKRDLEDGRKALMTDKQIARLLRKQEDFGMGSDDLLLFDGAEDGGLSGAPFASGSHLHKPGLKRKGQKSAFVPKTDSCRASDKEYTDDFDLMDHEQPSHRIKPKKRRSQVNFELSDSELEKTLRKAWENDRSKKRARRQEREELRAQGLLGRKKPKKPNMKDKYVNGITIEQMKGEIKQFLETSSAESLSLPPMDANARKIVHEVSHRHSLKSKSIGSGSSRFPVLYKTSRTREFDETAFANIRRKFAPRLGYRKRHVPPTVATRGGAEPGASYQDGEVVGAFAPELGEENKGRAMLEKMGWSKGSALGASNNKGISIPVAQIIKTTRAGLG